MCDPIVTKTKSCEDFETSVALQVEIPKGFVSESLLEYTKSVDRQHEERLEAMRTDLKSVNEASDKELTDLTETLEEGMSELETKMNDSVSANINDMEEWFGVQNKIDKFNQRINNLLEEFNLDVTNLEKNRCEGIKSVLGKYKKEFVNIGALSLKNIEEIFENIIYDVNRSTLENLTHREDLKLKFQLNGEAIAAKPLQTLRFRANELADVRAQELWEKVKKEIVRGLVAETLSNLREVNYSEVEQDLDKAFDDLMEALRDLAAALEIPNINEQDEKFWEDLIKALELHFENVNSCYLKVDGQIKSTTANIEESFDREKNGLIVHLKDVYGDEILETCSAELAVMDKEKNEELVLLNLQQEFLDELSEMLNKTKPFSLDIVLFRQSILKQLNSNRLDLSKDVETSIQKCLKKEQESISKIKTQLKTLREAPDKNKLEASSKILTEIFTGLSNSWNENFESNAKILEDFMKTKVPAIVQQTASEANDLLLEKYPKSLWDSQENDADSILKRNDLNSLMSNCIDCINLIEKRTLSMHDELQNYYPIIEYEISDAYDILLTGIWDSLEDQNQKALAELNIKIQNFEDFKKIRLGELEIHSERLKSHLAGVNLTLKNVSTTYEEIKSDQKLKLKEFNDSLTNFLETHEIDTRDQIKNAISALEREWDSLSTLLENRILDGKMVCQHKFETLKHSNNSFQKIAKHFKNGGNFSQNELTSLTKELKQLDKTISNQNKTLSNQYNLLMKDISKQELDNILKILQGKLNFVLLNDKIGDMLFLTRMKLRSEVGRVKTSINTFMAKVQLIDSPGKLDENLINEIVLLACSILDDLSFSFPLECDQKKHESSRLTPEIIPKKEKGSIKKKPLKKISVPKSLFASVTDEELKDGPNFLSRAKLIMSEKYSALIHIIEDAFKPKTVETAKSKKKVSKEEVSSEAMMEKINIISKALNSYNKECESIWYNRAQEFVAQLTILRNAMKGLSEQILDETHSAYVDTLITAESEFKSTALKTLNEGTSEIDKIRKSITLSLAHPTYQHKLQELHQQAKSMSGFKIDYYNELVCSYKDDLQTKHDCYVEKIAMLRNKMENTQEACFDGIPSEGLTMKLQELENFILDQPTEVEKGSTDLGRNQLKVGGTDANTEVENTETKSPEYPTSIWSDDNVEWPIPEHLYQFSPIEQVGKISIITIATSKLKDSVERIQRLYGSAEAEAKEFADEIAKCMRNLEFDINQAKLMYNKICK